MWTSGLADERLGLGICAKSLTTYTRSKGEEGADEAEMLTSDGRTPVS